MEANDHPAVAFTASGNARLSTCSPESGWSAPMPRPTKHLLGDNQGRLCRLHNSRLMVSQDVGESWTRLPIDGLGADTFPHDTAHLTTTGQLRLVTQENQRIKVTTVHLRDAPATDQKPE